MLRFVGVCSVLLSAEDGGHRASGRGLVRQVRRVDADLQLQQGAELRLRAQPHRPLLLHL